MRLASFNICSGRPYGDSATERFAEAVAGLDADVLALQEVDCGQPRSGRRDLAAEAAEAMGATDWRYLPTVLGTPGAQWSPASDDAADGPSYGIALLSRRPVRRWFTHRLPAAPIPAPVLATGPRGPRPVVVRDEPRAVLGAELAGGPRVGSTHLSFVPGWNVRQARMIRALPIDVLLGDLNLPAGVLARTTGWSPIVRGATWPAGRPVVQFDHVLARAPVAPLATQVRRLAISDHRAVAVDLPDNVEDLTT